LSDQNEMMIFCGGLSKHNIKFGPIGKVVSEEKIFFIYWPIRKKNAFIGYVFLSHQNEMRNFYRVTSKHHSCNVWYQLPM